MVKESIQVKTEILKYLESAAVEPGSIIHVLKRAKKKKNLKRTHRGYPPELVSYAGKSSLGI